MKRLASCALSALLLTGMLTVPAAHGQEGTPTLLSLSPNSAPAGGPGFTLTVNGTGFVSGLLNSALVQWNGSALSTGHVSANQLTAFVPASLIAFPGSANVTVVSASGVVSNALVFTISSAKTPTLVSLSP